MKHSQVFQPSGLWVSGAVTQKYTKDVEALGAHVAKLTTAKEINAWVSEQTENLVPDLLDDVGGVLVAASAVYFKGEFAEEFEADRTKDAKFTKFSGTTTVQMMRRQARNREATSEPDYLQYADAKYADIVGLPYVGGRFEAVAILPKDEGQRALRETARKVLADWYVVVQRSFDCIFEVPRHAPGGDGR